MTGSRFFRFDTSTAVLILANIVTIIFAVVQKWNVLDVMWVYWAQSVIIGCFTVRKILDLKQFSTEGMSINDRPVKPTQEAKRQTAWFFLFHYGFFHLGYFIFLFVFTQGMFSESPSGITSAVGIAVCILIFLLNHGFSYWKNRLSDMNRNINLGTVFITPYARIIPMHLTIIIGFGLLMNGSSSTLVLALFLLLKTLADVTMHIVEHRTGRQEKGTGSI